VGQHVWRLLGSGSGGANFSESFMESFMQFRFALLPFGKAHLQPLLCKNVQGLGQKPLVLSDLSLEFIALLTHGLTARSGGSKRTLSHRW
jgi:hypothetical protein